MRFAILGSGAVGGFYGAKLARAGHDVTFIARGAHLAAIRERGLLIRSPMLGDFSVRAPAEEDTSRVAPVDVVIVAVKAYDNAAALPLVKPMLGPGSSVLTLQNGVDSAQELAAIVGEDPVIGGTTYIATALSSPGVIEHTYSNRFDIGEPDGSKSERAQAFAHTMIRGGFRVPIRPQIRVSLWVKLWGNLSFNPVCALTMATLDRVAGDPATRAVVRQMMVEAQAVAEKLGITMPLDVDARIAGAEEVGAHKPSTLIDLERGRPMEVDAILGAVLEMGRLTNVAMPACEVVYALVRQRAQSAGCYPAPLARV
jgi:2-dehydropantoate 2-reductase